MLLQIVDFGDYSWIIGISLVFGLSFLLNSILKGNYKTLMLLMLGFTGVVVLVGILESYVLILVVIFTVAIIIIDQQRGGNN